MRGQEVSRSESLVLRGRLTMPQWLMHASVTAAVQWQWHVNDAIKSRRHVCTGSVVPRRRTGRIRFRLRHAVLQLRALSDCMHDARVGRAACAERIARAPA